MTLNPPLSVLRRIAASLASALAVVVVGHLVTLLVFFVGNDTNPAVFEGIGAIFLPSSLLAFVLLAVAASLEAYRFWFTAIAAGLISSVLAAIAGYTLTIVGSGTPLNGDVWAFVFQSVAGPHL